MKWTDLFIKRPVLATVLSLFIFLLGFRAIFVLPVREYPEMDNTVITVSTAYPGASADLVQGFLTTPIEKAISSAEGVDYFTSTSDNSVSTVSANIRLNFDPDKAFTSIMSKVEQIKNQLPASAQAPVIVKNTGSAISLMYISYDSASMTPQQITAFLTQVVQPKLSTLPGVSTVSILGGADYAMRVWLNPEKMAAFGVSSSDVSAALVRNNVQSAAGQIEGKYILMTVNASTGLSDTDDFKNLVINFGIFYIS